MKKILVCGAGGFIGSHFARDLKNKGHYVIGADLHYPEFSQTACDEFHIVDLTRQADVEKIIKSDIYEIYQFAADIGGAGYVFTGESDASIMYSGAIINLNILNEMVKKDITRIFYSSSACAYAQNNQEDPNNPICSEDSAYPANPDSEYGWEKIFSERLMMSFEKNYGIRVRICRFHNVFGPESAWNSGREKSPAALCRKVAMSEDETIEIWGPGTQTRSFLYIDEAIEGIYRVMEGDYNQPLNLGSERMISINNLAHLIAQINTNKKLTIKNIKGPTGVNGRRSDNKLIKEKLDWVPKDNLEYGLKETYQWILKQIEKSKS